MAILVETDNSWGSNLTRGVAGYAKRFGPWNLLIDPRDNYSKQWSLPDEWRGDGIIARVSTPLQMKQITESGQQAVNVQDVYVGMPKVRGALTKETAHP